MQSGKVFISSLGSVCVVCQVLAGSQAQACLAIFSDIHTEKSDIEVLIPSPTFTDCVDLPPGEYSVELRDVDSFGNVEIGVAYHIQEFVTVEQTVIQTPGMCGICS